MPQMIKVSATRLEFLSRPQGCHPTQCGGVSTPGKQTNKQNNSRQVNGEASRGLNRGKAFLWGGAWVLAEAREELESEALT